MLAELTMELEADSAEFGYYQSSNLQGILMEQIDTGYAGRLHEQGRKPYSQHLAGGKVKQWSVSTLTEEAYQNIILPLLDGRFREFDIEKKQMHVNICKKELKTLSYQELMNEFYEKPCSRHISMEIVTPASFKSHGRYINFPDMHYIYQSLMNKYSAVSEDMDMYDEETLGQLAEATSIVQYQLRSAAFFLEGVKIPSFLGKMCIRVNGTETMARYARLLMRFGEYSGIGIKTAIGMGGMKQYDGCMDRSRDGITGRSRGADRSSSYRKHAEAYTGCTAP